MNLYCPILPLSRNDQIRPLGFLFGPGGAAVTVSDGVSSSSPTVRSMGANSNSRGRFVAVILQSAFRLCAARRRLRTSLAARIECKTR